MKKLFLFDYILMKGNIRKITKQTIFEFSRAVETQKFDFALVHHSSIFRIFEKILYYFKDWDIMKKR